MAWFKAPEGVSVLSIGEKEYKVVEGIFEAAEEHVERFLQMGFKHASEPVAQADKDAEKSADEVAKVDATAKKGKKTGDA